MEKYQRSNILKKSHYCACKTCINRISDIWDEQSIYTLPDSGLGGLLVFKKVIKENVVIEEEEIHCAVCNELIGYKFIAGPTSDKEEDFLLIPKKLKRVAAAEEVDLSSIFSHGTEDDDCLPGNPNDSGPHNNRVVAPEVRRNPRNKISQDHEARRGCHGGQKRRGSSSGETSCPYTKYDKEEPELKGSIQSFSEYKDYVEEFQEKYKAYVAIHKILGSYKEEFEEYGNEYHASKGKDSVRCEEIEKQIIDAYRQIREKHQRLARIYILLHQELDNLKKMIKEFGTPYIEDETDAEIHPIEPPSMSEFTGVVRNVYDLVTAAKTIFEDEEEYLIIITLPSVDLEKVNVDCCNNQTHGIVTISSVSTFNMPFIQKNDRTYKLADSTPEHCPPGEFKREIHLPTRIPDDAELEVYFDEGGTMLEIKVPKKTSYGTGRAQEMKANQK